MTAETLKPFITPTSVVNNFPAKQASGTHSKHSKARQLILIILCVIALVLVVGILALTIWQTMRVRQLDADLGSLRREVENLRQRLGINYLEDYADFQKEYTNLLIHDPNKLDDVEDEDEEDEDVDADTDDERWAKENYNDEDEDDENDDDDDDEDASNERTDFDEYLDMVKKEREEALATTQDIGDETETSAYASSSAANDDNVFDDFTSYNDSKKKRERKSRSIADMRNDLQSNDVAQNQSNIKKPESGLAKVADVPVATDQKSVHVPRQRSRQSRQRLLVRRGESPVSAKSAGFSAPPTPAAHFHLNRKVSHHNAPIQMNSYQGDMYIGHATASTNSQMQQHFSVNNGVLTVLQPGLYYVYAQVCYNNTHDQNGFIIFHGSNAFLQCLNTVPTSMQKVHTCHTSGLIQLQEHETIHLRDIHRDRNVMLRDSNNRSYFGIFKV